MGWKSSASSFYGHENINIHMSTHRPQILSKLEGVRATLSGLMVVMDVSRQNDGEGRDKG